MSNLVYLEATFTSLYGSFCWLLGTADDNQKEAESKKKKKKPAI